VYNRANATTNAALQEKAGGGVGGFLVSTGLSIVNNAVNLSMGPAGLYFMAGQASGQTAYQGVAEGLDARTAGLVGLVYGAIEYLTEKIPFERMLEFGTKKELMSGAKPFLMEWLKQIGIEGAEEAAAEILDAVADNVIAGKPIDPLKLVKDTGLAALGGMLSGGVIGAPTYGLGALPAPKAATLTARGAQGAPVNAPVSAPVSAQARAGASPVSVDGTTQNAAQAQAGRATWIAPGATETAPTAEQPRVMANLERAAIEGGAAFVELTEKEARTAEAWAKALLQDAGALSRLDEARRDKLR
jgi:hypothetical protein